MITKLIEIVYSFLMGRPDSDPITGRQQCGNFTAYYSSDPDGNYFTVRTRFLPIRLFPIDMVRALVGTKDEKRCGR